MPKGDSLKKRYIFKVVANILAVATGAATQMIIPRTLGAAQYGNFNFLTDFFVQFLNFFNMGTSIAFYTRLSKRQNDKKLVVFYLLYIGVAVLLGAGLVFVAKAIGWEKFLWPAQGLKYVYMGVIFAGLNWLFLSMNDVVDAYGLTVPAEIAKIFQKVMGVGIVFFLFWRHWLNLDSIFCFNYVMFLLAILFFLYICRINSFTLRFLPLSGGEIKGYADEFYRYSKPLFIYCLIGLGVGIFDRWFLQVTGGGIQQGFYSLAYKIGALCFILTAAMTQLITREYSIAHEKQDIPLMARLFRRHIPLLYGITAIISCFMIVNADKMALIMGGKAFKGAETSVAIMAIYPMLQAYGQLSNAVFYATDQTRLYSFVNIVGMVAGVFVTYFLLASPVHYGLGLGAVGLAIKMVFMAFVMNNVLLYFNARFLKISFGWYLMHQLMSVFVFLVIAFTVTWEMEHWLLINNVLCHFLCAGIVYLIIVAAGIFLFPGLLGLDHQDIHMVVARIGLKKRQTDG